MKGKKKKDNYVGQWSREFSLFRADRFAFITDNNRWWLLNRNKTTLSSGAELSEKILQQQVGCHAMCFKLLKIGNRNLNSSK